MPDVDAIALDVGGVLLLPDPAVVGQALDAAGVGYDAEGLLTAHYEGIRLLDDEPDAWPASDAPGPYLRGFLAGAGVAPEAQPAAAAALGETFSRPSIEVWRRTTPTARDGLRLLAELGIPTAVVSNADGTVERQLTEHRLAQVGPGPGLEVAAIVDSWVVGVSKPDPDVFAPALAALGVAAQRCAYIGDTRTFDVAGARAAGLRPVHLDPLGSCAQPDHPDAPDLPAAVRAALNGPA